MMITVPPPPSFTSSAPSPAAPAFEPSPSPPAQAPFSIPTGVNLEDLHLDAPPGATGGSRAAPSLPLSFDAKLEPVEETRIAAPSRSPRPPLTGKVPEFTLDFGSSPGVPPAADLFAPPPAYEPLPLIAPFPAPARRPLPPFAMESPAAAADILSAPRAGFWIRLVAQMIDGTIIGFVLTLLFIILFFALGMEQMLPQPGQSAQQIGRTLGTTFILMQVILNVLSIVLSSVYFIYFHGAKGQTPGKMLLKLKVIQTNGRDMTYGKALLRFLGYIINQFTLMIGFLWVAFDKEKQGLHDKIAGTYVVRLR